MITILIKIAASLVLGVLAGFGAVYIFNKMPAAWLTDYDAKPPAELTDPHIQRVKGFPWRWIYAAGFSCLLIRLSFFDVQFAAAGLFRMLGSADHRACRSEIYDHTGSVRHHAGYLGVWLHPVPKRADAASSGGAHRRRSHAHGGCTGRRSV